MPVSKLVKISVILSIVPAIYYSVYPGKIVLVTIFCSYPLLIWLFSLFFKGQIKKIEVGAFIKLFVLYNVLVLIRGFFDAASYQDWTTLLSQSVIMTLFMPFTIYFGTTISSFITLLRTFFWYDIFLCGFLFFSTTDPGPYGFTHMLSPIYIFILFIPYLNRKYGMTILAIALFSLFSDISIRSNILGIIVALSICFSYLLRKYVWTLSFVKLSRKLLIFAPILFLILGLSGTYNIFTFGDMYDRFVMEDDNGETQDVFVDSRTSIYLDVFNQLDEDKSFLFGLGASGKTKTSLTDISYADFDVVYKEGRRSTESGMLNYIQYGGLFGGLLYFMLFVKASFLGIYKSNNWLSVMIGLWVAFKGLHSFIEDVPIFTISTVFIFAAIGVCLNKELRLMNDNEVKSLLRERVFTRKNYVVK